MVLVRPADGQDPGARAARMTRRARRVLVVDEIPLFRHAMEALLTRPPLAADVETAHTVEAAAERLQRRSYDVVVACAGLAVRGEPCLLDVLAGVVPAPPVVVLLGEEPPELAREAVRRSAAACLPKSCSPATLLDAMTHVLRGDRFFDESIVGCLLGSAGPEATDLTTAELDLLQRIGRGQAADAIAGDEGLTERRLRERQRALFDKLGVRSRGEAALAAVRLGLV